MNTTAAKPLHEGRNVKRIREILGVKQDTLALELGLSQQAISQLEQKEALDKDMLEKIAAILKVPVEAIKNFDEQAAINIISNTFNESAFINSTGTFNINPIDKWLEAIEENKKLYEMLLQSEKEKVKLLEKLLDKK
jgi:transcriptional regulator with XRE-family HTH domain